MFQSLEEMKHVGTINGETVDRLVWTAVFGETAELRGTARFNIRTAAAAAGIRPASIHDLYMAMGRGEAGGFTVPAMNVRAMAYDTVRALINEELAAGFYNIDIDTSTLVDLSKATLDEQQQTNTSLAAEFTAFIRDHEPRGVTTSVGGEIGEVGGKNSDVHELHAFMKGYNAELKKRRANATGISKISVQTGTAHGGFINPDGTVRTDVKIDLKTLEELSRVARQDYHLAGAVQHGASTLPPDAFDAFPRVGACEIHLATDFQNMVYDHPRLPAGLKSEMYAWLAEHAAEERKPKDTEEQFIYKARKKAIGPFKKRMWSISEQGRRAIGQALEERFAFLMKQLRVNDTAGVVAKFVQAPQLPPDRDAEIVAAGGKITAAEKKAEGLAD